MVITLLAVGFISSDSNAENVFISFGCHSQHYIGCTAEEPAVFPHFVMDAVHKNKGICGIPFSQTLQKHEYGAYQAYIRCKEIQNTPNSRSTLFLYNSYNFCTIRDFHSLRPGSQCSLDSQNIHSTQVRKMR